MRISFNKEKINKQRKDNLNHQTKQQSNEKGVGVSLFRTAKIRGG